MVLVGAVAVLVAGCNEVGGGWTFSVCGQALLSGGKALQEYDVSSGATTITDSGLILMTLSDDCAHGVDVQIPAGAASTVARATAKDGRTAGLVLTPLVARVDLTLTRPDRTTYPVVIDDDVDFSSPSPTD